MSYVARPTVIVTSALLVLAALLSWQGALESTARDVEAGFWFEPVSFASTRLGDPLDAADLARVQDTAMAEITNAFAGLRIHVSDSRKARYRVRVVQDLQDARLQRPQHIAGRSRGMAGFGGSGEVSFTFLASSAIVYAPHADERAAVVAAIGRGVGRAAVHEFTHQLLPRAPIHGTRDRASYEFRSAARAEQYFGALHWDIARPLLDARLAR